MHLQFIITYTFCGCSNIFSNTFPSTIKIHLRVKIFQSREPIPDFNPSCHFISWNWISPYEICAPPPPHQLPVSLQLVPPPDTTRMGWCGLDWTGLDWLRIGTSAGLWTFRFHKMPWSSWVTAQLTASQLGLSSMESVYVNTWATGSNSGTPSTNHRHMLNANRHTTTLLANNKWTDCMELSCNKH
jgi:hypothetical protein